MAHFFYFTAESPLIDPMPDKHSKSYKIFALLICISSFCIGQDQEIHKYFPAQIKSYGIEEGLPDPCVEYAHIDSLGKLTIIPCGHAQITYDIPFYQLDGFNSRFNDFSDISKFKYGYFKNLGVKKDETAYGIVVESQTYKSFYTYNLVNGTFKEYLLPNVGEKPLAIGNAIFHEGKFDLLIYNRDQYHIAQIEGDSLEIKRSFPNNYDQVLLGGVYPLIKVGKEYIFSDRYNIFKTEGDSLIVLKYDPDYLAYVQNSAILNLYKFKNGIIYSTVGMPKESFYLDLDTKENINYNSLVPPEYKGNFKNTMVFKDEKENLLTVLQYTDGSIKAFLTDSNYKISNYSAVINAFKTKDFRIETFSGLHSKDFTKQIVKAAYVFEIIDVTSDEGVTSLDVGTQRGIIELMDGNLYLSGDKKLIFNNDRITIKENVFEEINETLFDGEMIRINDHEIVIPTQRWFLRYNEIDNTFKKYDSDQVIVRLLYMEEKNAILLITIDKAVMVDLDTKNESPIELVNAPSYISQIFRDNEQLLFVSNNGIFKAKFQNNNQLIFSLLDPKLNQAANMMAIDSKGRYWIATFATGLYVYDPKTQELTVIDKNKGLSNNTIATLIQDDEGDFWIGTFNGITVINDDLEILGHIYESDGLNYNECNRWSVCKKEDGTIIFGSTKGISLIEPKVYKEKIKNTPSFKLYLSEIQYKDSLIIDDLTILNKPMTQPIKLPASNRNIKISYGVSDYSSPENASYAYMIEGKSNDWNYIGNIHDLSIIDLPRGKYNILIKGTNYRGQPTINQLSIPVHVGSYFYQTWWFYFLCALLLASGIIIWILRQKRIQRMLEEEVRKRTSTIQKQTEELKELDQLKSKLYTNITHEFRTPLTVIDGLADQMGKDPEAPSIIKRNTRNLLGLVNQMLDLRKLESGKMKVNLVQSDILSYIKYIGESFASIATSKGTVIHYNFPDEPILMDFDPEKLTRILGNLLSNAVKYTPDDGTVRIIVRNLGDHMTIEVQDNGIGIPQDQIQNIFSQYYQVDNEVTRTGVGTGIGLTLVHELVHVLGGEIEVKSEEHKGSSFTVKLPITHSAKYTDIIGKESVIKMTSSLPLYQESENNILLDLPDHGDKSTILLVEDNHDVLHYLILCLKDDYNIKIAHNGKEGLTQALKWVPSIIISDVMMPEMTGYELCEKIKGDLRISHIPIVLLTAKADQDSKLKGLRYGADEYLMKPFNKEELLTRLQNIIKLQQALHQRYATFSELSEASDEMIKKEDAFILEFRKVIKSEIDNEQFGVPEMCKKMGMGKTQLHEKLKSLTGKTPIQYQRMIKMNEAKILLQNSDANISEIAFNLGFKDPKYFSKVFKEEYGVSPSDYFKSL